MIVRGEEQVTVTPISLESKDPPIWRKAVQSIKGITHLFVSTLDVVKRTHLDDLRNYEFVKKRSPELEMAIVSFQEPPKLTGLKSFTMYEGQIYHCYLQNEQK